MKKVKDTPKLDTGAVKIYLDDIRAIVEVLHEFKPDGALEISIGGYEFQNIDELKELEQKEYRAIDLSYKTSSPYTQFEFWVRKSYTHLSFYGSEDSLAARGAFANIEKIILSRRKRWQWIDMFLYATLGLLLPSSTLILEANIYHAPMYALIGLTLFAVTLLALIVFLLTIPHRKSQIILVEKTADVSFWNRNKETIIIAAISSSISFLLGILGTLFAQSVGK